MGGWTTGPGLTTCGPDLRLQDKGPRTGDRSPHLAHVASASTPADRVSHPPARHLRTCACEPALRIWGRLFANSHSRSRILCSRGTIRAWHFLSNARNHCPGAQHAVLVLLPILTPFTLSECFTLSPTLLPLRGTPAKLTGPARAHHSPGPQAGPALTARATGPRPRCHPHTAQARTARTAPSAILPRPASGSHSHTARAADGFSPARWFAQLPPLSADPPRPVRLQRHSPCPIRTGPQHTQRAHVVGRDPRAPHTGAGPPGSLHSARRPGQPRETAGECG